VRDEVRARLAHVATAPSGGQLIEAMDGVQAAVVTDAQARSRRILEARLRALVEAEARLRDGNYGICETCGEAIPRRRLEALPEARQCVACAEAAEAGQVRAPRGRQAVLTAA
jgi:RNA polymerase-binding transcription factor DksA